MTDFRSPMLAKDYDPAKLRFPASASPKIDGWRAVIYNGVVTTRSGKPIRNKWVQMLFGRVALEGLDGEITVGKWNEQETYNRTETALKRFEGEPRAYFHVFDIYDAPEGMPYVERQAEAQKRIENFNAQVRSDKELYGRVGLLAQTILHNHADLDEYETEKLEDGFEGVMLRGLNAPYKYGRSTANEGHLLKVKRFRHDEARIIGFEEQMINDNEAFKDELGRTKRASNQENLRPSGKLGAFICKNEELWPGQTFNVSCGSMSHADKLKWWPIREQLLNAQIRFRHLPHGAKVKPRHGLFDGFRAEEDTSHVE